MIVGQNFELYTGDTDDIYFALTDVDGTPMDLSNLTLWWGMGTIVKNDITVDGNVACVHLVPEDTIDLTTGGLRHQLRAVDPLGRVETFATGTCRVIESVFQPTRDIVVEPVRVLRLVGGYLA